MDGKRRLPLWMVGASTGDRVSKCQDDDTIDIATKGEEPKPKSKGRIGRCNRDVCLPKEEASETSFVVKCETKRSKRKVEKDVTDCDAIGKEIGVEKTKRHWRKKGKKSLEFEGSNEIEASSPDSDDGDLTVDEMLSIAKEYVGQQKSSKGTCPKAPQDDEIASHHNMTSEVMVVGSGGDPAQDMLELFLGPLLKKKPMGKEGVDS